MNVPRLNPESPLTKALAGSKRAFWAVALLSALLNILLLGGSIFMMMVYDMVLPSGSLPTLVGLLFLVTAVYIFQGYFDVIRSRIMADVGASLELSLSSHVNQAIGRHALHSRGFGDGLQPMRDLDQIRSFLSSAGPTAFIDLPWMLFFTIILFLMHPWLGFLSLFGVIFLTGLTLMSERMSQGKVKELVEATSARNSVADANRRHAPIIRAMGMEERQRERWFSISHKALLANQKLTDVSGTLGAISKMTRIFLQSAMLAMGAWIVIRGEGSGGIIFASAILSSRALAPVELAIANWRNFVGARQSWVRLDEFLGRYPLDPTTVTNLPAPTQTFAVEGLTLAPPGAQKPNVMRVSFNLSAGDALGVIGPSGSGKTSLMKGLLGVWPALEGKVRLDGAAIDQWLADDLGKHIGYVPQNVELLQGTIAQNISRFEPNADSDSIINAAKSAGVHDLILRLPQGYETVVDADGAALSAGQSQRVALARALYGDPFLIILDEPNSNLDAEGEDALSLAIRAARQRNAIVIMVAHRPSALREVNLVLFVRDGTNQAFGPRDEVLEKVMGKPAVAPPQSAQRPQAGAAVLPIAASAPAGSGVVTTRVGTSGR